MEWCAQLEYFEANCNFWKQKKFQMWFFITWHLISISKNPSSRWVASSVLFVNSWSITSWLLCKPGNSGMVALWSFMREPWIPATMSRNSSAWAFSENKNSHVHNGGLHAILCETSLQVCTWGGGCKEGVGEGHCMTRRGTICWTLHDKLGIYRTAIIFHKKCSPIFCAPDDVPSLCRRCATLALCVVGVGPSGTRNEHLWSSMRLLWKRLSNSKKLSSSIISSRWQTNEKRKSGSCNPFMKQTPKISLHETDTEKNSLEWLRKKIFSPLFFLIYQSAIGW